MEAMDSKVEMAMAMDRVVMASKVEMAMEEMEVDIPVVGMVVAVVEEVEGDIRWDGMG
jgi:enoyl-CoA hydratase/carnithine racemase